MAKESQEIDLDNSSAEKQESNSLVSRNHLLARLKKGPEARVRFVESHLSKGLAFQIRSLRDREHWSQAVFSEKVGMNQNAISRLENPSYGKPTISTLKRIAGAFDVALVVRFVPFSQLIDWVSGTPFVDKGISIESLAVPSFDAEEKAGIVKEHVATSGQVSNFVLQETAATYVGKAFSPGMFIGLTGVPVYGTLFEGGQIDSAVGLKPAAMASLSSMSAENRPNPTRGLFHNPIQDQGEAILPLVANMVPQTKLAEVA